MKVNIKNVVLYREERLIKFDTDFKKDYSRTVRWSNEYGQWSVERQTSHEFNYEEYLKGVPLDGPSREGLALLTQEVKPDQVKQPRYLKEDGTDTIDKWAATRSIDAFRVIMFAQIEKYNDRLGKKDPILEEVTKMADYMNRWVEYEKQWIDE